MGRPGGLMRLTLAQRTSALLDLVEQYRQARSAEILDPARAQARELVRSARAEGRRRVHTAVAEARSRIAAEVGAAQARLATERRLADQKQAVCLLAQAWSALHDEMLARWRNPLARRLWCEAHLARAHSALADKGWRIEYAADLPEQERDALAEQLRADCVAEAAWQPCEDIAAGLRVRAGSNLVDATIDGLLDDRSALEGRLLEALLGNGASSCARGDEPSCAAAQRAGDEL